MIGTATDQGIWINGELCHWEDPTRKTLHECAYITQKRLGGDDLCSVVDELLEQGVHSRDIAWALINTQFDLKKESNISATGYFKREALKLSRARAKALGNQ